MTMMDCVLTEAQKEILFLMRDGGWYYTLDQMEDVSRLSELGLIETRDSPIEKVPFFRLATAVEEEQMAKEKGKGGNGGMSVQSFDIESIGNWVDWFEASGLGADDVVTGVSFSDGKGDKRWVSKGEMPAREFFELLQRFMDRTAVKEE